MWDLPGPGVEPVSPALEGGFLTTAAPAKSQPEFFLRGWPALLLERAQPLETETGFVVYIRNNHDSDNDKQQYLLSTYYMPSTIPSTSYILTHLILMTTL